MVPTAQCPDRRRFLGRDGAGDEAAWGSRYVGDRDSVYSLVKRLRRKLSDAGVELDLLAVRGIGFQLVPRTPAAVEAPPLTRWEPEAG